MADPPDPVLLRFAREQRANGVQADAFIWRTIRDRRCEGAKFRRQVPLGSFIVDFVCFERRLIVEIDGPTHQSAERQAKDSERDAWLGAQGFRILRLPNELVIASTELAVARIRAALNEQAQSRRASRDHPSSVTLRVAPSPTRGERPHG
jgi:very-short-patch-repair endonuclease